MGTRTAEQLDLDLEDGGGGGGAKRLHGNVIQAAEAPVQSDEV